MLSSDLSISPSSGLLVFAEGQNFGVSPHSQIVWVTCTQLYKPTQIIGVTAVRDDIPELSETYTVSLLDPYNIGDLSAVNHTASVTIRPNQNPHGLLEIYFTDRYIQHSYIVLLGLCVYQCAETLVS